VMIPLLSAMTRLQRLRRVRGLVDRLEAWEQEGRDLLAQVLDLSDPDEDLACECRRLLEHLDT